MKNKFLAAIIISLWICNAIPTVSFASAPNNLASHRLFERRLFRLDVTSKLTCQSSEGAQIAYKEILKAIAFYEAREPATVEKAALLLTQHSNSAHSRRVNEYRSKCASERNASRCLIRKYWEDEELANRVLAIFYDTGIVIQRDNADKFATFTIDQVMAIEKSIRKIPTPLLSKMSKGGSETGSGLPGEWVVNGQIPITIVPGLTSGALGSVVSGSNLISFNAELLDRAKSGQKYSDVGYQFLADFRLHMIIHEMAHVLDGLFFLNDQSKAYFFHHYVSHDPVAKPIIDESSAALWPSHWWDALEGRPGISNGRYATNNQEKFAEFFSQYILFPQGLKHEAPQMYDWLKKTVFAGIEYTGYESCRSEIVRPLANWEMYFAPSLIEKD